MSDSPLPVQTCSGSRVTVMITGALMEIVVEQNWTAVHAGCGDGGLGPATVGEVHTFALKVPWQSRSR